MGIIMTLTNDDIKKIIDFDKNGCNIHCDDCYFTNICFSEDYETLKKKSKNILTQLKLGLL
jgi:hypothetical protein